MPTSINFYPESRKTAECSKESLKECHFDVITACSPEEPTKDFVTEPTAANILDSMYHEHVCPVSEVGKYATAEKFPILIMEEGEEPTVPVVEKGSTSSAH